MIRDDKTEHACRKEGEETEKSDESGVLAHITERINEDEEAYDRNDEEHHQGEGVDDEADDFRRVAGCKPRKTHKEDVGRVCFWIGQIDEKKET